MRDDHPPISTVPLGADATYARAADAPRLVHLDDPALQVMTDFRRVRAVTTRPEISIDLALDAMKRAGVRLLLVADPAERIVGLVSASDIQGEKPIKLAGTTGTPHSRIRVDALMQPVGEVVALDFINVRNARVGHVLATLKAIGRRHLLVVETQGSATRVRGLFSLSQIAKQMGTHIHPELSLTHSFGQIHRELHARQPEAVE